MRVRYRRPTKSVLRIACGDAGGGALYTTAGTGIYNTRLNVAGILLESLPLGFT